MRSGQLGTPWSQRSGPNGLPTSCSCCPRWRCPGVAKRFPLRGQQGSCLRSGNVETGGARGRTNSVGWAGIVVAHRQSAGRRYGDRDQRVLAVKIPKCTELVSPGLAFPGQGARGFCDRVSLHDQAVSSASGGSLRYDSSCEPDNGYRYIDIWWSVALRSVASLDHVARPRRRGRQPAVPTGSHPSLRSTTRGDSASSSMSNCRTRLAGANRPAKRSSWSSVDLVVAEAVGAVGKTAADGWAPRWVSATVAADVVRNDAWFDGYENRHHVSSGVVHVVCQ